MLNIDIKLQKPEKYYGAIYTHNAPGYKRWLTGWVVSTFLICSSIHFITTNALTDNILVPILFLVTLGLLFPIFVLTTIVLFVYNKIFFKDTIHLNRIKYAHTVFKTWVEQKHGIEIDTDQALQLMNGNTITIVKNSKKYEIYLKETIENKKLFTIGNYLEEEKFNYKNWDYDTDKLDLQLLFKKQYKQPKEKTWH